MTESGLLLVLSLVLLATSVIGAATTIVRLPARHDGRDEPAPGGWFQPIAAGVAAIAAIVYAISAVNH